MQLSTMITIVLGFSTCVSPALVALINNRHARELRKIELEASKSLKKIELNAELSKCFVLSDRDLKYKVIFNFIDVASHYLFDYSKYLRETSERIIGRRITPHTLRHTHASLLMEQGIDIESISKRLGHNDSRVTKEIYLHVTKKLENKRNEQLRELKIL